MIPDTRKEETWLRKDTTGEAVLAQLISNIHTAAFSPVSRAASQPKTV